LKRNDIICIAITDGQTSPRDEPTPYAIRRILSRAANGFRVARFIFRVIDVILCATVP
jgi:hypothetical protein